MNPAIYLKREAFSVNNHIKTMFEEIAICINPWYSVTGSSGQSRHWHVASDQATYSSAFARCMYLPTRVSTCLSASVLAGAVVVYIYRVKSQPIHEWLKPISQLRFDYDTTIWIWIVSRQGSVPEHHTDELAYSQTTMMRLRRKIDMFIFARV